MNARRRRILSETYLYSYAQADRQAFVPLLLDPGPFRCLPSAAKYSVVLLVPDQIDAEDKGCSECLRASGCSSPCSWAATARGCFLLPSSSRRECLGGASNANLSVVRNHSSLCAYEIQLARLDDAPSCPFAFVLFPRLHSDFSIVLVT